MIMSKTEKLKLEKKVFVKGEIVLKTGLHVGGSSLGLSIGGADKVVVRNPFDNLPYIPGSSIKGKMRSLLEKAYGLIDIVQGTENGKTKWTGPLCTDPSEDIVQLFGYPADATGADSFSFAPTRLTVRDAELDNVDELANAPNTDMYCTEIKTEVSIDRLTSVANPRNFERVPAGARFCFELVLDLYNLDWADEEKSPRADRFVQLIGEGLALLQDDYLGGQGTRGYGQVKFNIAKVEECTADHYRNGGTRQDAQKYDFLIQKFSASEEG